MAFLVDFQGAGEKYTWEDNNNSTTKEKYLFVKVKTEYLKTQLKSLLSWDLRREIFYFKGPVETSTKTLHVQG